MSSIEVKNSPTSDDTGRGVPAWQPQAGSRRSPRPSRALFAALLSLLVPGAGQLYLGWFQRGVLMLGVSGVVVSIGIGFWLQGSLFMLGLLVRPSVLIGLLVGNLALLAFRLFAVYDAYRLGRTGLGSTPAWCRPLHRFGMAGILTLFLILAAAPHAAAGYYNILTYDLLTDIFSSNPPSSTVDAPRFTGTPPPVPTIPADL